MKRLILVLITIVTLSSCSRYFTFSERRTTSLTPDFVRLDVQLSDFDYLGKTEISISKREYLFGLIKRIDSVNNRVYNYRDVRRLKFTGPDDIKLQPEMQKAAYKVVDEFPDATYYILTSDYENTHKLFLGSRTLRTVEIQAFKYKVESN